MSRKALKKHKKSRSDNMKEETGPKKRIWRYEHDGNKLEKHIYESLFIRSICWRTYRHKIISHTLTAWTVLQTPTSHLRKVKVRTLQADIYMWDVTSARVCVVSRTTIASLSFQPRYQKITTSCYASIFVNLHRLVTRIKINNPSPLENLPPFIISIIKYHKQWKKTADRGHGWNYLIEMNI